MEGLNKTKELQDSQDLISKLTVAIGTENMEAQELLGDLAELLGKYQGRARALEIKLASAKGKNT